MYLGIDLGTSAVKAVLLDDDQTLVAEATAPLIVLRPQPFWSEQEPESWWQAAESAVAALRRDHATALGAVRGIGLSGQMHGAVLLDEADRVLRPAILWNDGRSAAECEELERRVPRLTEIAGNLAMPGFTAPKLVWVARHEPVVFKSLRRVLLPKDYLRLRMTGEAISDMSDSAGTLWLDMAARTWSLDLLAACDLVVDTMPRLVEGSQAGGYLRADVAAAWGVPAGTVVAGGAGDNAAGACGVGVVNPGDAFLSLGTSGVLFVVSDGFRPNPGEAVHAFCHCLPGRWHQMAVMLSCAVCLTWIARQLGFADEAEALLAAEASAAAGEPTPTFLPYLGGERTPHNDPHAQGVLCGLGHETSRGAIVHGVLQGVAFGLADGLDALRAAGTQIEQVSVIGGGARSPFWGRLLADALNVTLVYHSGGTVGPALGAARLGRLAATGEDPAAVCMTPPVSAIIAPRPERVVAAIAAQTQFRSLYHTLKPHFAGLAAGGSGDLA